MLKNYLKTAFRNLVKYKGYSFINISGLALGIACCLLIMLYVKDEMTFDKFHENGNDTYRVRSTPNFNKLLTMEYVSLPVGPTLKEELPEVINQCRYTKTALDTRLGDKVQSIGKVFYAEPEFLEIFSFPNQYGDALAALSSTSEIVLVEKTAKKLFGEGIALGKKLELNIKGSWKSFSVGAILKDLPSNSSIDFELLLPFQVYLMTENRLSNNSRDWFIMELTFQTFIQTQPNTSIPLLTDKINDLAKQKTAGVPQFVSGYDLQSIYDLHFSESMAATALAGMKKRGDLLYSKILIAIAGLVLFLACINFTNLSLARSLPRAKEIGIRKVVGAKRSQLMGQFLGESILMSTTAFLSGLVLAQLALPFFELATEKEFSTTVISSPIYVLMAFVAVTFAAFLAGMYPALIITKFKTVQALKGNLSDGGRKEWLQKGLIILQFSTAGVLIIGLLAMNRQINFLSNIDRGYDDSNLISVNMGDLSRTNLNDSTKSKGLALVELIRDDLSKVSSISKVSGRGRVNAITPNEGDFENQEKYRSRSDFQYLNILGVTFLEGRSFRSNIPAEGITEIIVNESYARTLANGESIRSVISKNYDGKVIIGIVKDFNLFSPVYEIRPTEFGFNRKYPISTLLVKFEQGELTAAISAIRESWIKFNPNNIFDFELVEESNASQFSEQERWRMIILAASLMALLISCLGLFGLAFISTQRRLKEIGVRKVFGASIHSVVYILSRSFSFLVLMSILVASPIAFYLGNSWLSTFPYRVDMNWDLILIAGFIQAALALATVSYHTIKAAVLNPVKILRYE